MQRGYRKRTWFFSFMLIAIITVTSATYHITQNFMSLYREGMRYFNEGSFHRALPYLFRAHHMEPSHINAAFALADNYLRLDRGHEALQTLKRLYRHHPRDMKLAERIADFYYGQKAYGNAARIYEELLADGWNVRIAEKLAEIKTWQKEYDAALALYYRLEEHAQAAERIIERIARILTWSKRHEESLPYYRKLLECAPEREEILLEYANAAAWTDRYDLAVRYYKIYLEKNPDEKEALLRLADTLRYAGRNQEALDVYKKYLAP